MSHGYIYFQIASEESLNVPILVSDLLVQQDCAVFIVAKETIDGPTLGQIITDA